MYSHFVAEQEETSDFAVFALRPVSSLAQRAAFDGVVPVQEYVFATHTPPLNV